MALSEDLKRKEISLHGQPHAELLSAQQFLEGAACGSILLGNCGLDTFVGRRGAPSLGSMELPLARLLHAPSPSEPWSRAQCQVPDESAD